MYVWPSFMYFLPCILTRAREFSKLPVISPFPWMSKTENLNRKLNSDDRKELRRLTKNFDFQTIFSGILQLWQAYYQVKSNIFDVDSEEEIKKRK